MGLHEISARAHWDERKPALMGKAVATQQVLPGNGTKMDLQWILRCGSTWTPERMQERYLEEARIAFAMWVSLDTAVDATTIPVESSQ